MTLADEIESAEMEVEQLGDAVSKARAAKDYVHYRHHLRLLREAERRLDGAKKMAAIAAGTEEA